MALLLLPACLCFLWLSASTLPLLLLPPPPPLLSFVNTRTQLLEPSYESLRLRGLWKSFRPLVPNWNCRGIRPPAVRTYRVLSLSSKQTATAGLPNLSRPANLIIPLCTYSCSVFRSSQPVGHNPFGSNHPFTGLTFDHQNTQTFTIQSITVPKLQL